jgi:hypothetical protein
LVLALASGIGAGVGIRRWDWHCYLIVVGVGDVATLSDVGDGQLAVVTWHGVDIGVGVGASLVLPAGVGEVAAVPHRRH